MNQPTYADLRASSVMMVGPGWRLGRDGRSAGHMVWQVAQGAVARTTDVRVDGVHMFTQLDTAGGASITVWPTPDQISRRFLL